MRSAGLLLPFALLPLPLPLAIPLAVVAGRELGRDEGGTGVDVPEGEGDTGVCIAGKGALSPDGGGVSSSPFPSSFFSFCFLEPRFGFVT